MAVETVVVVAMAVAVETAVETAVAVEVATARIRKPTYKESASRHSLLFCALA